MEGHLKRKKGLTHVGAVTEHAKTVNQMTNVHMGTVVVVMVVATMITSGFPKLKLRRCLSDEIIASSLSVFFKRDFVFPESNFHTSTDI